MYMFYLCSLLSELWPVMRLSVENLYFSNQKQPGRIAFLSFPLPALDSTGEDQLRTAPPVGAAGG